MSSWKNVDPDVIRRCQAGSTAAFDNLYDGFADAVWRICYRMAGNAVDAEDLAQDVWITVWRQIGSFRCESAFYTWLYRVASNVCLQWHRRSDAGRTTQLDVTHEPIAAGPDQKVIMQDDVTRIQAALGSLPDQLRLPLVLKVDEELSYAEIAEILGCTSAAVKMRICRARAALMRLLEEGEV